MNQDFYRFRPESIDRVIADVTAVLESEELRQGYIDKATAELRAEFEGAKLATEYANRRPYSEEFFFNRLEADWMDRVVSSYFDKHPTPVQRVANEYDQLVAAQEAKIGLLEAERKVQDAQIGLHEITEADYTRTVEQLEGDLAIQMQRADQNQGSSIGGGIATLGVGVALVIALHAYRKNFHL
tara:strand:- start:2772 stop:3323 length:552 start_codon:yes stop_codon:yes gene_type:complete